MNYRPRFSPDSCSPPSLRCHHGRGRKLLICTFQFYKTCPRYSLARSGRFWPDNLCSEASIAMTQRARGRTTNLTRTSIRGLVPGAMSMRSVGVRRGNLTIV